MSNQGAVDDSLRSGRVAIPGSERNPPPSATKTGDVDPSAPGRLTVVVRPRAQIRDFAARFVDRPPHERTYLTRKQFAAEYGAEAADLAKVEAFAASAGLAVEQADIGRRSVVITGPIGKLAAAFGADLGMYDSADGNRFRGRRGNLSVPAELAGIVNGVFGFDERPQARTHFRKAARATAVPVTPLQMAQAYAFPSGDGSGKTIAILELGGGFSATDLATYFTSLGIASPPKVSAVSVDGATNAPTNDPNGPDAEVMLDIEVAGAVAPGANVVVYFAPNTDQGFLDAITTAIHDETNAPCVLSISWGGAESTWTAQSMTNMDDAFAAAAALGVTITTSAGDSGSNDGVGGSEAHVDFPASSPHVLACGGTKVTLGARGALTHEVVWNDGKRAGATGGGISATFPVPAWQADADIPPSVNSGGAAGRGVPDVSSNADPKSGYDVLVDGEKSVIGGTSAASPLWAGLIAILCANAGNDLGFINAQLYGDPSALRDITSGNNGAYKARKGWDACTGFGSPNGAGLETLLVPDKQKGAPRI